MSSPQHVSQQKLMAKANNHLAVRLHEMLAEEGGNVFFSPFSVSTAMAMLLSAAEGNTALQLRTGLGHTYAKLPKKGWEAIFEEYLSAILEAEGAYSLKCAQCMLIQQDFHVKDCYKSIISESFKALLMETDFKNDSSKAVAQINKWVAEQTNGAVPKLVDSLNPQTVIVLLNAVYFKGSWLHKFSDEKTTPKKFFNNGLEANVKDVDMMRMGDKEFFYAETELFQALKLPYIGQKVAMLVLLPRARDGLAAVESSLAPTFLEDIKKMLRKEKVKVTQQTPLAKLNNHLAVHLYGMLAEEGGNVFFSPFSVSTAMAMLLSAAEGDTAAELRAGLGHLHAELPKEGWQATFEQYLSVLLKEQDAYSLNCANCLLSQEGFHVKDRYKSILEESFKALLMEVDVQNDASKVVGQINKWVGEQTKGMIPKLLDSLDPATVIVLLNAVYFKGSWLNKFDERGTHAKKFYNKGLETNAKDVDMMHMRGEMFLYTENDSFQALQLPYIGEDLAMVLLLPRVRGGLAAVESSLAPTFLEDLEKTMRKQKVGVVIPKFRLEYSKSLVPSFQRLGIKKVFERGAELGVASDSSELAVSDVQHKAVLVVNEEGSEAAAATIVVEVLCSMRFDPVFVANHPFLFVIYDTRHKMILFMGRVEEL